MPELITTQEAQTLIKTQKSTCCDRPLRLCFADVAGGTEMYAVCPAYPAFIDAARELLQKGEGHHEIEILGFRPD